MARELAITCPGGALAGRLHRPRLAPRAAVVIAHGLHSSMQSDKLTRLAQALARGGYAALQFDHLGCGASPGAPEQTTLSRRRDEYLAAVAALRALYPDPPLAYMGSSLGGSAAILAAQERPPACLLCWSTPVDLAGLLARLEDSPEARRMAALVEDLPRHDLPAALGRTRGVFFVHGELDEVVPVAQARLGHGLASAPKGLLVLPGADHRLSRLEHQLQAMAHSFAWLGQLTGR